MRPFEFDFAVQLRLRVFTRQVRISERTRYDDGPGWMPAPLCEYPENVIGGSVADIADTGAETALALTTNPARVALKNPRPDPAASELPIKTIGPISAWITACAEEYEPHDETIGAMVADTAPCGAL